MTRIHRGPWAVFTARELQVLRGMAAGKPSEAIARELGVKLGTVRIYRSHVRAKLRGPSPIAYDEVARVLVQAAERIEEKRSSS